VFITAGPSTKEYLYEPAADAQRRAGSAGSSAAGPHFSGGGCHGPTAAPAPPGRVRGSPDPPRGALALGGRAASGMRPRRTRKDAPVRQGPAQRDPTFRGGDGLLALTNGTGQKQTPAFSNLWRTECSEGVRRRTWKRLGRCRAFQATNPNTATHGHLGIK
jgi:hypothetical protein